ncbi:macrophage mannose receptor 1-like isoform X2 [Myripristis murdjan]|uniref:macrophage mannose receptor 1-like isoform X2 n=1 Tax=Myripristis murdjan TaxID=586833 RepID=UPI001175F239|nr:macrophage mannose receptor 1-like isoform X2 [Myripristis murdjan]
MEWRLCFLLLLAGLCAPARCLPRQYHFIEEALPWLDAQVYCREMFTDLATVEDVEEMNRLMNTAQDTTGGFTELAWIGLHLADWRWSLSDESYYVDQEADYRNWDAGRPKNFKGNQLCVQMKPGGVWDDAKCSQRRSFVCYNGGSDTFVFVDKAKSWASAQRYCRRFHTDLASVRNQEENQRIQNLSNDKNVWIGLYRKWEWSDHSGATYRNWRHGQPNNFDGNQECTAADLGNAGLWSDESCKRALAFVCYGEEKEATTTASPTTIEEDSTTDLTETEITSSAQTSTTSAAPTTSAPEETTTTTSPTTTEEDSTSDLTATEATSSAQPSTTSAVPKTSTPEETPISTTNMTPNQTTTTQADPTTELTTSEMTSAQTSPPAMAPTPSTPVEFIGLDLPLAALRELSENDVRNLVAGFRNQLIELGLPRNIRVGLRITLE